jgi:hypothetical protein
MPDEAGSNISPSTAPASAADPATGAAPAADASAGFMSREQILDQINQAPAEDRAELYQQYSDIFHRAAPPPSREQVMAGQDAGDAEIRLAALLADPNFARRYAEGGIAERREIEELKQTIAAGGDPSVRIGDAEVVDAVTDVRAMRRHDLFGALSDLHKGGIPLEGIEKILDGNWSDGDVEFAQRELDRLVHDPDWQRRLLAGDRTARHEQRAWSAVAGSRRIL